MTAVSLEPTTYYRIFNDAVGLDARLNDGYNPDSTVPGPVSYVDFVRLDRYSGCKAYSFATAMLVNPLNPVINIANLDHGRGYQLGIDGPSIQLLESTTKLNQQWTIERSSKELFSIQNMAGNDEQFLGIDSDNNPVMTTGIDAVWWRIESNDAGPVPDDMLEKYTSIEQLPVVATGSTATITTTVDSDSGTMTTADASLQAAASTSASTSPSQDTETSTGSISAGAIAGGVVGGVAVLAFVAALLFFFCVRRRRKSDQRENKTPQTPSSVSLGTPQQWGAPYSQKDVSVRQIPSATTYTVIPASYAAPPLPITMGMVHEMEDSKGVRAGYVELPAGR